MLSEGEVPISTCPDVVGGRYGSLKQGIMPTGNGACDVRAAANAFLTLFTAIVCSEIIWE